MQDMTDFMREYLDYYFSQVHTDLPGVVVEYDASKRRATVQPSLKRRAGNKEYIPFPLLIDVPVQYPGTKRWTIHFPLEAGDEVSVYFSERALEAWKDVGQDGIEDPDPRRYSLSDAYCVPGLQPQEFISATEPGLQIIHKDKWDDGKFIDEILIDDDQIKVTRLQKGEPNYELVIDKDHHQLTFIVGGTQIAKTTIAAGKIETLYKDISSAIMEDADIKVKYKEKCQVLMEDDHINMKTEKNAIDMTAQKISETNGLSSIVMNGGTITLKGSGGSIVIDANVTVKGGMIYLN
jgi:hypothetical protein